MSGKPSTADNHSDVLPFIRRRSRFRVTDVNEPVDLLKR